MTLLSRLATRVPILTDSVTGTWFDSPPLRLAEFGMTPDAADATFAFMDRPAGTAAEFQTFFGDRVRDSECHVVCGF